MTLVVLYCAVAAMTVLCTCVVVWYLWYLWPFSDVAGGKANGLLEAWESSSAQELRDGRDFIVIVSHRKYDVPLRMLLESLDGKWPLEQIVVIMNDEHDSTTSHDSQTGLTYVSTPSNVYEYTGFFVPALLDASKHDAFLLLHDTCLAQDKAGQKIREAFQAFRDAQANIMWCSASGQCNIAIFDRTTSDMVKEQWEGKSMTKQHAIDMEHNNSDDSIKRYANLRQAFHKDPSAVIGTATPYNPDIVRQVLYFPSIDVQKFYVEVADNADQQHPQTP